MGIEQLENWASEKELIAGPSLNKDVSLKNQQRAELLRSRIEELDRRLAILNSERGEVRTFREAARRGSSHGRHPRCGNAYRDKRMVVVKN
jgi:hypothetical protein